MRISCSIRRNQPRLAAAVGVFRPDGTLIAGTPGLSQWLALDGIDGRLARLITAAGHSSSAESALGRGRILARRLEEGPSPAFLVDFRPPSSAVAALTPRQLEVCEYAAVGATVTEIAAATRVGPETVRAHLKEAYRRLDVANRVELARALA